MRPTSSDLSDTQHASSAKQSPSFWTSGPVSVIAAYSLFSLSAPLTKFLMMRGDGLNQTGGNAISFCNLLFLGNLSAALLVLSLSRPTQLRAGLVQLSGRGWGSLIATSLLAIATPMCFFYAIKQTSVANVIFISRAGPIFYAVGGTWMMGKQMHRNQITGYAFIAIAIMVALTIGNGLNFRIGDGLALLAALGAAFVSLTGKAALDDMGLKPFVFSRNLIAAVAFGVLALIS
ncbi:MAG: EamA family transporter, partial [Planctomycetota bacterium]